MADRDRLSEAIEILGFDPTKRGALPKGAVEQALKEITDERDANRKEEAKKVLSELITILEKRVQIRKQFDAEDKKIEKEAGKLINRLRGVPDAPEGNQGSAEVVTGS